MNKILITIDCGRYDAVIHNDMVDLKNIKELMGNSFVYHNVQATAPYTPASHCSMLTGLYPYEHGIRRMYDCAMHPEKRMIQVGLQEQGYYTAVFTGYDGLIRGYGMNKGWDYVDENSDLSKRWGSHTQCGYKGNLWLENFKKHEFPKDKPVFVWLHFFHLHTGGEKALPFKYHNLIDPSLPQLFELYDAKLKWFDEEWLPVILDKFDFDNTDIYLTSDHGDDFGKYELSHKQELFEETLHVPLIWKPIKSLDKQDDIYRLTSGRHTLMPEDAVGYDWVYSETENEGVLKSCINDGKYKAIQTNLNGGTDMCYYKMDGMYEKGFVKYVDCRDDVFYMNELLDSVTLEYGKGNSDEEHKKRLRDLGYL